MRITTQRGCTNFPKSNITCKKWSWIWPPGDCRVHLPWSSHSACFIMHRGAQVPGGLWVSRASTEAQVKDYGTWKPQLTCGLQLYFSIKLMAGMIKAKTDFGRRDCLPTSLFDPQNKNEKHLVCHTLYRFSRGNSKNFIANKIETYVSFGVKIFEIHI